MSEVARLNVSWYVPDLAGMSRFAQNPGVVSTESWLLQVLHEVWPQEKQLTEVGTSSWATLHHWPANKYTPSAAVHPPHSPTLPNQSLGFIKHFDFLVFLYPAAQLQSIFRCGDCKWQWFQFILHAGANSLISSSCHPSRGFSFVQFVCVRMGQWRAAHAQSNFSLYKSKTLLGDWRTPSFCTYATFVNDAPMLCVRLHFALSPGDCHTYSFTGCVFWLQEIFTSTLCHNLFFQLPMKWMAWKLLLEYEMH